MLHGWKHAALDLLSKRRQRGDDCLRQIRVDFEETRRHFFVETEHVLGHERLTVAGHAGADADGGNLQRFGQRFGEADGKAFEHQRENSAVRHLHRVRNCLARRAGVLCG